MTTLLLIHAAATLTMVGLIWFVQIVHYPLFSLASEGEFCRFATEHQRRTGLVVGPLMLTELGTAIALVAVPPPELSRGRTWFGLGLLAFIWISTTKIQVPIHRRLSHNRDLSAIRTLVATNWLRTIAWSLRGLLSLVFLAQTQR